MDDTTCTSQRGFTLVESVIVIAITGILSAIVAVFIKPALDAYFDQARRAELTDLADTALRRIARDLRLAVPNTVRVSADQQTIELLLAKTGGRYRFDAADEGCFTTATCNSIVTRGSVVGHAGAPTLCTGAGTPAGCTGADRIVIFNQYNNNNGVASDCTSSNPSAYCGNNTSPLTATTDGGDTDTISFTAKQFVPANGSASRRFQVMEGPVSYTCPGNGQLQRLSGYGIRQHISEAIAGGSTALLANRVTGCTFTYQSGAFERWGVVGLTLTLTIAGESVTLYHEVHIDNAP